MKTFLAKVLSHNMKSKTKQLYCFMPLKYRMSKKYWEFKRFLEEVQWWDKDQIEKWQINNIRRIVKHAYNNSPGYYFLYKEAGCKPDDIQNFEDVRFLPFITKKILRDNIKDFTSKIIPKKKQIYVTTSGSTGIPFGFYDTTEQRDVENAFISSIWGLGGFHTGCKMAVLRGAFIGTERKPFGMTGEQLYNALLLSSYYLTDSSYPIYREKILKYRPVFFHVYPSSMTVLSDIIIAHKDEGIFDSVKGIFTASENLYIWQKENIQRAFPKVRIFDFYGHAEHVIMASMCEYTDQYHIWPFYGFTEVLNKSNKEAGVGEGGELIGTSFWSYATPFIRYRTMDIAKKGTFGCNKCERQFQLIENIEGRLQEIIVTKTGRFISMTAINMHDEIFDNVKQFQFYQDTPDKVIFKVVIKDAYNEQDTKRIYNGLKKKLGQDIELEIVFADEIPRTSSGKYRFLEQKLKINYGE